MKLTCMRGYSGSGKSTKAAEIAKETGAVVVCRDDLRKMMLGSYWTGKKEDEDRVTVAEEAQVTALLRASIPVVVDATHLHPPYLRKWAKLATRMGVEFEVVDIVSTYEYCVLMDKNRAKSVGEAVVHKQFQRWPREKWPTITAEPFTVEPVEYIPGPPGAIIVDIDGTLAHIPEGGRSPYDYSRVGEDEFDEVIAEIANDWQREDYAHLLIVSGRDDSCRADTIEWLLDYPVYFDDLFMRPSDARDGCGNKIPDYQVKYDLFNKHIRGKYNVRFVLDDRQQVVDMWRQLGLKCLQVAPGDF